MNENQPETGIIIEEICGHNLTEGRRFLVLGHRERLYRGAKTISVMMLNLDTGEIEWQRRDFDWYNWYHHPTGWDY
jgi:hypothetical protein